MKTPNAELKKSFDRDGYVVLRGWLDAGELKKLKAEVDRYLREVVPTLPPGPEVVREIKDRPETLKLVQLPVATDEYFKSLRGSGKFRELAELMLGDAVVPQAMTWMNKPARVGADTPPHQDGYYYMLEPSEAVAMWLALDKADESNGCMRYIPGSQRRGMRNHGRTGTLGFSQGITDYGEADRKAEVVIRAEPGDLIVHHCQTIHRADSNPSERQRPAIQFVYFAERAKEDAKRKAQYRAKLQADLAQAGENLIMPESQTLRFAMLGMVPGNGHPYSWSAIVNGYDRAAMAGCPYPGITKYLNGEPFESVRVPGARITHIWTDKPEEAPDVAKASLIPHVVGRPEEVIEQVDAVFVAAGEGFDHVARSRPFVEAGLPVFVDKPLALTVPELQTFLDWKAAGARILSSSAMRYAVELEPLLAERDALGELRWISSVMAKDYENYAIHALEPLFRLLGPGFVSAQLEGQPKFEMLQLRHRSGVRATLPIIYDAFGSFGTIHAYGTKGHLAVRLSATDHTYYTAFRRQIVSFVDFVRSGGVDPFPFADTVEMMAVLIAGLRSRAGKSRPVEIAEIMSELRVAKR